MQGRERASREGQEGDTSVQRCRGADQGIGAEVKVTH
jgi:hypothetical protein